MKQQWIVGHMYDNNVYFHFSYSSLSHYLLKAPLFIFFFYFYCQAFFFSISFPASLSDALVHLGHHLHTQTDSHTHQATPFASLCTNTNYCVCWGNTSSSVSESLNWALPLLLKQTCQTPQLHVHRDWFPDKLHSNWRGHGKRLQRGRERVCFDEMETKGGLGEKLRRPSISGSLN